MIPLFKTDYSIGKSILTTKPPEKYKEGGVDSIFKIAQDYKFKNIVVLEDSMIGFLEIHRECKNLGIGLKFGLRIKTEHGDKIAIFAKNGEGCKLLNKIYSFANTKNEGKVTYEFLKQIWDEKKLKLAIPFYDSFLFHNLMYFENCIPDFSFTKPTLFLEENGLIFDEFLKEEVLNYAKTSELETQNTKSIFYKNRDDFDAYVTYRCICNRAPGKAKTLNAPNLDYMASREFCWESYLDGIDKTIKG